MKAGAVLAVLLACGCSGREVQGESGSDAACCAPGNGAIEGDGDFVPLYVRSRLRWWPDGGVDPSTRFITISNLAMCRSEPSGVPLRDLDVTITRPGGLPVVPGAFPVTPPNRVWPDPRDGGPGPHGERCEVGLTSIEGVGLAEPVWARSGVVTVDNVDDQEITGSFRVEFDTDDAGRTRSLTGWFDAPTCSGGGLGGLGMLRR